MKVTVVGHTQAESQNMAEAIGGAWLPEDMYDDASALSEFAGRACYESWSRPNPATATADGYIGHIIEVSHFSVLEHGSVSFYIQDVSRSLTHELVRHRHFSFSQLSQRYAKMDPMAEPVIPPLYQPEDGKADGETYDILMRAWRRAVADYEHLVALWHARIVSSGVDGTRARKMAREAARAVLPNMTPTAIVVTGNHRSWREFLDKRGSIHADAEIRALAGMVYTLLIELEPAIYQDYRLGDVINGSPVVMNVRAG